MVVGVEESQRLLLEEQEDSVEQLDILDDVVYLYTVSSTVKAASGGPART